MQRIAQAVGRWFPNKTHPLSNACTSLGVTDAVQKSEYNHGISWLLIYHLSLLKNPLHSTNAASKRVGKLKVTELVPGFPLWEEGSVRVCHQTASSAFLSPLPSPCAPQFLCLCTLRYHWSRVRLHPEEPQDDRGPEPWLPDREEHQPSGVQAGHHVPERHSHQAHRGGVQAAAVHPPQHPPAEGIRLLRHLEGGEVQALGLAVLEGAAAGPAAAQPERQHRLERELLLPVWHQPGPRAEETEPVERAARAQGCHSCDSDSWRDGLGLRVQGQAASQALPDVPVLRDLLQWQQQTQAAGRGWAQVGQSPLQPGLGQGPGTGPSGQGPSWAPAGTGPRSGPLPLQWPVKQQWLLRALTHRPKHCWCWPTERSSLRPQDIFTVSQAGTVPLSVSAMSAWRTAAMPLLVTWARDLQPRTEQWLGPSCPAASPKFKLQSGAENAFLWRCFSTWLCLQQGCCRGRVQEGRAPAGAWEGGNRENHPAGSSPWGKGSKPAFCKGWNFANEGNGSPCHCSYPLWSKRTCSTVSRQSLSL